MERQGQGCEGQHRSHPRGDAPLPWRARQPPIHRALAQAVDRAAGAGRLPRRAERSAGRLRRTAPGRAAGWHGVDRGNGQLPGQSPHEQIAADALVAARCRSAAPGPLRRLQRHVRRQLRAALPGRQRPASASSHRGMTPNLATSPPPSNLLPGRVPPRVRGSTPRPARAILGHAAHRLCRLGSPACAGIDLGPISRRWRRAWFSRPRGDRPSATTSACVQCQGFPRLRGSTHIVLALLEWAIGSPACAGIDPRLRPSRLLVGTEVPPPARGSTPPGHRLDALLRGSPACAGLTRRDVAHFSSTMPLCLSDVHVSLAVTWPIPCGIRAAAPHRLPYECLQGGSRSPATT